MVKKQNEHSPRTPKKSPLLDSLGAVIKKRRIAVKLSQEELAYKAGFDRTYISLIERGQRNITFLNLQTFAKALGCSMSDLIFEAEGGIKTKR